MRHEFSRDVVERLAKRAGYRCSRPDCGVPCVGPSDESSSAYSNIGRAAHITAASPGGPRFDPALTPEDRRSIDNAIWLCASDAALIDTDTATFTVALLQIWKKAHGERVRSEINRVPGLVEARDAAFLDWVNRIRSLLTRNKVEELKEHPGRHVPTGRLLAPGERGWAARAVAEGHLGWTPGSEGVLLPGESFTFGPKHPHDPIEFRILNPGAFDDTPELREFHAMMRHDFGGVPGHTAFEYRPTRGRAYFFRLGWPAAGPEPTTFGVGPSNSSGVLGFMHDRVTGQLNRFGLDFHYFGASNPLTPMTAAYLVFPTRGIPSPLIAGFAPAPDGPPTKWSRLDLRLS
jgi:hypothetical protein